VTTEIHLKWDAMTQSDIQRQKKPRDISIGRYGYICCPDVLWALERSFLKAVFDADLTVFYSGNSYLFSLARSKWEDEIERYIKSLNIRELHHSGHLLSHQLTWLKSIVEFYKLGVDLEIMGKNPEVSIYW